MHKENKEPQTGEKDPNEEMMLAFSKWLLAGEVVRDLELKKKQFNDEIDKSIKVAELAETDMRLAVEELMNKSGVREDILPGQRCDYKINFRQMPETVKIADEKAVPEKFIEEKTERSVKKKEVLKWIKELRKKKESLPNWATVERAPDKLQWELIKK